MNFTNHTPLLPDHGPKFTLPVGFAQHVKFQSLALQSGTDSFTISSPTQVNTSDDTTVQHLRPSTGQTINLRIELDLGDFMLGHYCVQKFMAS